MTNIDLDNLNEDYVYSAFGIDGNEGKALNDIYLELFELIDRDGMLKLLQTVPQISDETTPESDPEMKQACKNPDSIAEDAPPPEKEAPFGMTSPGLGEKSL